MNRQGNLGIIKVGEGHACIIRGGRHKVRGTVYTIEEICRRVSPVAQRYHLKAVYLFGSYARGEAHPDSDIDLIVDTSGTDLNTLFKLGGLYSDLEEALEKQIDMITVASIMQPSRMKSDEAFKREAWENKVGLYAAA